MRRSSRGLTVREDEVGELDVFAISRGWIEQSSENANVSRALLHWPEAIGAKAWEEKDAPWKPQGGELKRGAEDVVQNFGNLVFRAELRHVAAFIGAGADTLDFHADVPVRRATHSQPTQTAKMNPQPTTPARAMHASAKVSSASSWER